MARASIMLAARLVSEAGNEALSEALNSLVNHLGDSELARVLLALVRAYEGGDRAVIKHLGKLLSGEALGILRAVGGGDVDALLNASREGGVGEVCEAIQYLIADLMRALPRVVGDSVSVRVSCA